VSENNIVIREIRPEDNLQMEAVIKGCFLDFNLPLVGTAYEDDETPLMYEAYQNDKEVYLVVANETQVLGGAGIKKLKNYNGNVCELQKMYFSAALRGQGYGKKLIKACLEVAKTFGYDMCYLETIPDLKAAIHIYERNGFTHRTAPLGDTGHYNCGIWMEKTL